MDARELASLPWPAILIGSDGKVLASAEAGRVLAFTPGTVADLDERIDVVLPTGVSVARDALPWRASGEPLSELQVWRDRPTGRAHTLRVVRRAVDDAVLLALHEEGTASAREVHAGDFLQAMNQSLAELATDRPLRDVLRMIVELACTLTRARYGALGLLRKDGRGVRDFIYVGVTAEEAARIGHLPEGKGLLGALIRERRTIRTARIDADPRSSGMPAHHPSMTSFLGTPLVVNGEAFGNFYLTDKQGAAEFSDEDALRLERFSAQAALTVKLARQAEEDQRRLFLALIENAPYGIVFYPAEGHGEPFGNSAAARMLGDRPPAPFHSMVRADGSAIPQDELPAARALRGETTVNLEAGILARGRPALPVLASAAPVVAEGGRILGAVVVYQDITPLKELEQMRRDFLAVVAHDMRAPVQAVLLHAESLLHRATGQAAWVPVTTLQSIRRSGLRLSHLISDLLDASRLEAGSLALDRRAVDVPRAVRSLLEQIQPLIGDRPVMCVEDGHPSPAWVDPVRLDQIMTNLVENAAKYSTPGTPIRITIEEHPGAVVISIRDQGPGIPAEDLPRLFERYYRGAGQRRQGVGLGLYIARGLIEAHGGTISVESELGVGTVFRVSLPTAAAEDERLGPGTPLRPA